MAFLSGFEGPALFREHSLCTNINKHKHSSCSERASGARLRRSTWDLRPKFPSTWGKPEQLKSWPSAGQEELPSFAASALMSVQATGVSFRSKVQGPRSNNGGSSQESSQSNSYREAQASCVWKDVWNYCWDPRILTLQALSDRKREVDLHLTLVSPDLNSQARSPVACGLGLMKRCCSVQQH